MEAEFQAAAGPRARSSRSIRPRSRSSTLLDAYATGDVADVQQAAGRLPHDRSPTTRQSLDAESRRSLKPPGVDEGRNPLAARGQLRSLLQPVQPVLLRGRAVRRSRSCWACCRGSAGREPLRRASIWLLWFTFALHTLALVGRIYISGRPPVTNLYSSAIFIGWACVLLALVFESIYRLGLGNIVAAVDRLPHAARRPLPLARRRHVHRAAGRARHAVLARHARRLHHAGLRDHVSSPALLGIALHPARRTCFRVLDDERPPAS